MICYMLTYSISTCQKSDNEKITSPKDADADLTLFLDDK